MGSVWVKEFIGGLDTRKLPETTPGGVLTLFENGHITRGGEIEQRAAFVLKYQLPAGTISMAYDAFGIVVFGSGADPGVPVGVAYQQLQHPDTVTPLTKVLSFDRFSGKVYAVGLFSDGSRFHFYDGARVLDWYDGRARASFRIASGGSTTATAAVGFFDITGGSVGSGNQIDDVMVAGVSIMTGPVVFTTDAVTTASLVAAAINSLVSAPDYTASATGARVYITAVVAGAAANGRVVDPDASGTVTTGNQQALAGGADAEAASIASIRINGVLITGGPVPWTTDSTQLASDVASAINGFTSNPDYEATSVGDAVNITAAVAGTDPNGRPVQFSTTGAIVLSPATGLVMLGGSATANTFQPGAFVKTIGTKMHSTSESNEFFSGIGEPTKWTTDTTGAGFIDMSSYDSGSEKLTALAKYQDLVAVFADRTTQLWYMDPDPTLNKISQTLNNTGTTSPRSVTQFGDSDLFYLDESGIRSLKARYAANSAATSDVGVAVDTLVTEALADLSIDDRIDIIGVIEPRDGRFWLSMLDQIFVLSFFSSGKVSAWSLYKPGFVVTDMFVFDRKVYLRTGDQIYIYGGDGPRPVYDDTEVTAWMPYLDADVPAQQKEWTAVDLACRGTWEIRLAMMVTDTNASDVGAIVTETTYNENTIGSIGTSSHISLRLRSTGRPADGGPAKVGAAVIHYMGDADED